MSTVIDASALIAFLRDEPGAGVVENVLSAPEKCYAHALNLCEVYYDFFRASNQNAARRRSRICSTWESRIGPTWIRDSGETSGASKPCTAGFLSRTAVH